MPAGGALVDARRQGAHCRHPVGDFLAEHHTAAARLRTLPDNHLDSVGPAQIMRVHAVAGRQILVDQDLGMPALFLGHAAITGGRGGPGERGTASQRLLGGAGERAEAHPRDCDRDLQLDRLFRMTRAEHHIGPASLTVAFQRIARDRGPKEQQIVKMRYLAFRTGTTDIVDPGRGGAADFRQRVIVEGGGLTRRGRGIFIGHLSGLNTRRHCRC